MATMFNPWKELGAHRGTPPEELKLSYQRLARDSHPDKVTGDHDKFIRVTEAYRILRSTENLAQHLRVISTLGTPCAACDGKGYRRKQISFTAHNDTCCVTCEGSGYIERKRHARST